MSDYLGLLGFIVDSYYINYYLCIIIRRRTSNINKYNFSC